MKPLNPILSQILRNRFLSEQGVGKQIVKGIDDALRGGAQEARAAMRGLEAMDEVTLLKVLDDFKAKPIDAIASTPEGTQFFAQLDNDIAALIEKNMATMDNPEMLAKKVYIDLMKETKIGEQALGRKYIPLLDEINSRVQSRVNTTFEAHFDAGARPIPQEVPGQPRPNITPGRVPFQRPPVEVPSPKRPPAGKEAGEEAMQLGKVELPVPAVAAVPLAAALRAAKFKIPLSKTFLPIDPERRPEEPEKEEREEEYDPLSKRDSLESGLAREKLGKYSGYYRLK